MPMQDKTQDKRDICRLIFDINFCKFRLEEICTVCRPMAAAVL